MSVHTIRGRKVHTSHVPPPMPIRRYDWSAVLDDYEPGDKIGRGETEEEAIKDLMDGEEE